MGLLDCKLPRIYDEPDRAANISLNFDSIMDLLSHSEKIIHPFTVDASLGMLMIEAYIGADKHIARSIDCAFFLVFLVLER